MCERGLPARGAGRSPGMASANVGPPSLGIGALPRAGRQPLARHWTTARLGSTTPLRTTRSYGIGAPVDTDLACTRTCQDPPAGNRMHTCSWPPLARLLLERHAGGEQALVSGRVPF